MSAEKIGPHHLERKAILYVRQSSAHQVLHNRESGALQQNRRDCVQDRQQARFRLHSRAP